jgi:alcohol dehydrogenase
MRMSTHSFRFFNPVKIVSGENTVDNLGYELSQLGAQSPLILTDKGVAENGLVDLVRGVLDKGGKTVGGSFDKIPADSSTQTVDEAASIYKKNNCDSIITVGGGSVIDTGKAVNITISEGVESLRDLIGAKLRKPVKPHIVIPTTAGTGSEATWAAMIMDPETNKKLGFFSFLLFPNTAILDPRMTASLPALLTASTAMDAMTHAIEGYTCKQKNSFSDAHSIEAIKLISENLTGVLKDPDKNKQGRFHLANAACLAGVALSNAGVALVHALGHALGGVCHVPHGVAMNIFLPHGLEYNIPASGKAIGELLMPLAGAEVYSKTPDNSKASETVARIHSLKDTLFELAELPRTLKEAGVKKEDFEEVAEKTLSDAAITLNPSKADHDAILKILNKAY